jgi:uncharacterized tellurite resistance protein B-like protein
MFNSLKGFLDDLFTEAPKQQRPFEASDYRLAAVALLVHLANVDGVFDASERARLQEIVEARFGLNRGQAYELINLAAESERDSVDLFRYTSVLKRLLDEDGRREVVAMLWDMAYADGVAHEFEENVIWRVAELLSVSARDRVELRRAARAESESDRAVNPWSKKP